MNIKKEGAGDQGSARDRQNAGISKFNNAFLSVEIRAAQIESALGTLQLTAALAQLRRTIRTVLARICLLYSRPIPAFTGRDRPWFLGHAVVLQRQQQNSTHAARSFTAAEVRLQQSARISHAPSLRHTLTYFPRSVTGIPSALRTTTEKRPSSMAISPE